MIAITLDADWALPEVVLDAIVMIQHYGCRVTLFATGRLPEHVVSAADEIALHPHFLGADLDAPIAGLKAIYPEAIGTRSHCLFSSERLRPVYARHGIRYESNNMQYLQSGISCSTFSRSCVSVPLYFMDRFHLEMSENVSSIEDTTFDLSAPGMKVFDFHPIHLVLNTKNVYHYEIAKPYYHNLDVLRDMAERGPGTRTLLLALLDTIRDQRLPTYTMAELAKSALTTT